MRIMLVVVVGLTFSAPFALAQSPPAISPSTYTVVAREAGLRVPPAGPSAIVEYQRDIRSIETKLGGMELQNSILTITNKVVGKVFDSVPGLGAFGDVLFEGVEKASDAAFARARDDLYDAIFAKARARDAAAFEIDFGGGITDRNYERARQLVYGEATSLAKEMETRRGQDAEAIRAQDIENLQAALGRSIALSGQGDAELTQRIDTADGKIDEIGRDLRSLTDAISTEIGALKEGQDALERSVGLIKGEVEQNSTDIAFMQQILWGQMSASEQLEALKSGTFLRQMEASKRQDLQAQLETLARIEKAGAFLAGVGNLTQLASKLGVISGADAENLQQNIQTARQAADVVTLILDQKWFSAAGAAIGLFGGATGPSAEHVAVMRSLEEIKGQLREIRQQNELIRQSIFELRDLVVAGFSRVDQRIDIIQSLQLMASRNDLAACRNFAGPGLESGQPPRFTSYRQRAMHFAMERDRFLTCFRFVASHLERSQLDGVSELYLNKVWMMGGHPIDDPLYRRESHLALAAFMRPSPADTIPAGVLPQSCVGKYIAVASLIATVGMDWIGCSNASNSLGAFGAAELIQEKLSVPLVANTANILLALAPYDDLVAYDAAGGITGLRSEAEMMSARGAVPPRGFAYLLPDANNLLTYAMAQQATITGAAVAPNLVRLLAENQFAGARRTGTQPCAATALVQDPTGHTVCSTNRGEDPAGAFRLAAAGALDQLESCDRQFNWYDRGDFVASAIGCELADNLLMRNNIGLALGQMIVQATSRHQYAAVWGSGDPGFMAVLLRDPDLSWLADAAPTFLVQKRENGLPPQWSLSVATPTGLIQVPLPSPPEAARAAPSMPPAWYELADLRDRVAAMYFGTIVAPEIAGLDPWTLFRLAETTPEIMGR